MSRLSLGSFLTTMLVVAGIGYFYGVFLSQGGEGYIGALYAIGIFAPVLAFQQVAWLSPLRGWVNRLPSAAYFLVELAIYVALIAIGCALAGTILWYAGILETSWYDSARLPASVLVYSLAASILTIFVLRLRDLVGREVFFSLLTSRYRVPVQEERIFLFLDLIASTSFAERHGDLRAQQYLGEIFRRIAEPVRGHKGSIDDYVGDSVIISWQFDKGARDAACVACVFDIFAELEKHADRWLTEFGETPELRAALHGGSVIIAEIGVDHHKITYFGDTVNTTARLEGLCRTLGERVLISADLAARLTLPATVKAVDHGQFNVRGRGQELGVVSLALQPVAFAQQPLTKGNFSYIDNNGVV